MKKSQIWAPFPPIFIFWGGGSSAASPPKILGRNAPIPEDTY